MFCFLLSLLLYSYISKLLRNIETGHHNDKKCEWYHKEYESSFGQELPDCEYKGNKSKIQNLIRKIHIDANGSVTEVQFDNKKNDKEVNVVIGKTNAKSEEYVLELLVENRELRKKLDEANKRSEKYRQKLKETIDSLTNCLMD